MKGKLKIETLTTGDLTTREAAAEVLATVLIRKGISQDTMELNIATVS